MVHLQWYHPWAIQSRKRWMDSFKSVTSREFRSIFTIIIWFFVFTDNSLIAFLFTILAWITLVIWGLNFKNLKFNKYCLAITIASLLWSFKYIIYWLLLLKISEYSILYYNILVSITQGFEHKKKPHNLWSFLINKSKKLSFLNRFKISQR